MGTLNFHGSSQGRRSQGQSNACGGVDAPHVPTNKRRCVRTLPVVLLLFLAGCASTPRPSKQWTENGWMSYKFAPREQCRDRKFEAALRKAFREDKPRTP